MRRVKQKDRAALEELYDRYVKLVYAFARKSVADDQAVREIVQAVFVRLWTTEAEYRANSGKFVNWLLTITRNITIDHLRKKRQTQGELSSALPSVAAKMTAEGELPHDAAERGFAREKVRLACEHLSASQARLIERIYWQGYTLREAAEQSGEPLGTVKNRLHQALKILRRHLSAEEGLF
jgi:RNA polymerase sigma-70 factor (ECF subfamily)